MEKFWENLKILYEYYEKTVKTYNVLVDVLKNAEIITKNFRKTLRKCTKFCEI